MDTELYIHRYRSATPGAPLAFLFHGTGGDENQLSGLGEELMHGAATVSPRGDVSEHGAARFFRRTGEGVYDMEDLAYRTERMAAFVKAHVERAKPSAVIGIGYSNGANILAATLFEAPSLFDAAVLMHPLIPFAPSVKGELSGARILVTAGRRDPICPPNLTARLESHLRDTGAAVELVWHDGGHELRPSEVEAARNFLSPYRQDVGGRP